MQPEDILPLLRDELALLDGPVMPDGQPSWTLHDPVRNLFFQLDWASFEILSRWSLGSLAQVVDAIEAETTLQVQPADVQGMVRFLQANELLQPSFNSAPEMAGQRQRRKLGVGSWLLHNYLFFRVPLVRPDAWLSRWAPRLDFLYRPGFRWLTFLALLGGLWSVLRSWELFTATLVDLLSWQGVLAYGLTLVVVKSLHELGHGITAKRYGCRVPAMGVAFLVMWPVAYTDTNEVWKLTRRDQRIKVAAAGILTEMLIAIWALAVWGWLPEGVPKSMAFVLATTSWVSTLLINASPFMRFDGYFLLSDYLQMPNLHGRAFALARWDLRERLFRLGEAPPEPFPVARRRFLIAFAWMTWLYRLVLFLGIAVLVYHFFIKALGIALFLVEIAWFVAKPLHSELEQWWQRRAAIAGSRRARWSLACFLFALLLFAVPWPMPVRTEGLLESGQSWALHALEPSQLVSAPIPDDGEVMAKGEVFRLYSPALAASEASGVARSLQAAQQSAAAGFDQELRQDWQVAQERIAETRAQQQAVLAEAARYRIEAPGTGVLRDIDPDLRAGDWLARRELLGRVVSTASGLQVVTYVEEGVLHRIRIGDKAIFVAEAGAGPVVSLRVASIGQDAVRSLDEAALSVPAGGHVEVRHGQDTLYPERPVYRLVLHADGPVETDDLERSLQHRWRGHVSIRGRWEAPGARFVRTAASVFWREAGF